VLLWYPTSSRLTPNITWSRQSTSPGRQLEATTQLFICRLSQIQTTFVRCQLILTYLKTPTLNPSSLPSVSTQRHVVTTLLKTSTFSPSKASDCFFWLLLVPQASSHIDKVKAANRSPSVKCSSSRSKHRS
jgi:hypothetical protein